MTVICETCKKEFDKLERFVKKSEHHFCSRKCSNTKSNENRWKNHVTLKEKYKCQSCGKKRDYRTKHLLCEVCYSITQTDKNKSTTLGELKHKHNQRVNARWYSAEIRNFARNWNPTLVNKPCQECGYSKHTELCHIKAIKNFDDDATLGEINHPTNLLVLCPNHHWEFDNK